jgi:hypothetical protein
MDRLFGKGVQMNYVHIVCKKCGVSINTRIVGDFILWKSINWKKLWWCRRCRETVKVDFKRVE